MRYMILVKATPRSEAGERPEEPWGAAMADYHRQLAKAGVLLDAAGLRPSGEGWRIRLEGGGRLEVSGPFRPARELVAGYALIQVRSGEEALEWARRFPVPQSGPAAGEIEVRRLCEPDDVDPDDAAGRFRESTPGA